MRKSNKKYFALKELKNHYAMTEHNFCITVELDEGKVIIEIVKDRFGGYEGLVLES